MWKSEVRESVVNRKFFFGVFLLIIVILAVAYPYRIYLVESGGSAEGPAWIAVFVYSISSERTLLFLPLFVPLAAAGNVQEEMKSRFAVFLVSRAGKKNYLAGKILGAALSGGLMALAAVGIGLAVIVPWCAGIPDLSSRVSEMMRNTAGTSPEIAEAVPSLGMWSLLPAFLCSFLNGAFWALAGSAAAVLAKNHYLGYAVPFILYYVLTVFQERYYADLYILSPRQWAYPSYYGAGVCITVLVLLALAAALLLTKLTERRLTG